MRSKLSVVTGNARDVAAATTSRAKRVSAGPAVLRLLATVAAFVALGTALPLSEVLVGPLSVPSRIAIALFVVSCGVGLFPRTRWVSLVALGAVGIWLIATLGFDEPVTVIRVGVLATALYLMHASAALAAALPYDCAVAPGVLRRWLGRVASVLGLGLVVGLGGMAVTGQLPAVRSVVGPIVGSVVAAGLAGLLAWHLFRRRG